MRTEFASRLILILFIIITAPDHRCFKAKFFLLLSLLIHVRLMDVVEVACGEARRSIALDLIRSCSSQGRAVGETGVVDLREKIGELRRYNAKWRWSWLRFPF